jgi:hypothetical protein
MRVFSGREFSVGASLQWEPAFSIMIDRRLHSNLGSQDHVILLHFSQFIGVASMSKASDIFDCPVTPSQSAEYKERTVEQKTSNLRYKLISTGH